MRAYVRSLGDSVVCIVFPQVRSGAPLPNEAIVACAKIFKDELTLDNISRAQVSSLMGIVDSLLCLRASSPLI